MSDPDPRWHLHRLHVAGFRSIRRLTLDFDETTLLVGPNGAGKSNILDALLFLGDAVTIGLRAAIGNRDGIGAIRRRTPGVGRPSDVRIEAEFTTPALVREGPGQASRRTAVRRGYGFTLGSSAETSWYVKEEWVSSRGDLKFHRREGKVLVAPVGHDTDEYPPTTTHLSLPLLARPLFVRVVEALESISRYSIHPEALRAPQPFDASLELDPTGDNLAHVWRHIKTDHPDRADRIVALLGQVVPGIVDIETQELGRYATLEASFDVGPGEPLKIDSAGLSDGTLRALALLVALYQPHGEDVVAIEEPEIALHPYAAGLLFGALLSSPERRQLIVSTHSPAILETPGLDVSRIRVVEWANGATIAGPIATDLLRDVRDQLATGSELLAEGALRPKTRARYRSLRPSA